MRHTGSNALDRLWNNGVILKLTEKLNVTRVLKTKEEIEANTNPENVASAVVVSDLYNNLGGCQLTQEGNDFYITGADSVRKKLGSGGSGTLKVNFSFSTQMNNNDGYVGTGSGTLTVVMTNGAIASYNISGSGSAMTIGGAKNASGCSVFAFRITSITWDPN